MNKNYKMVQKQLTELNADGNDTRGREGEDLTNDNPLSSNLSSRQSDASVQSMWTHKGTDSEVVNLH